MFSTLRIVAVIGVLTYLSPVRQEADGLRMEDVLAWGRGKLEAAAPAAPADAPGLWTSLPEPARRALVDQIAAGARSAAPKALSGATDTLQPDDLRPPWRGAKAHGP